jgi:hypothetical protein
MHICASENCSIYMTAHVMPLIVIISNLHTLRSHVVHFFLWLHPVAGA